mgnify:FL=1
MTSKRVLIVEDEAVLRRIVADAVERAGYSVAVASDGEEGLRLFESDQPHLVIADIMLPRLDGLEMVRAMRKSGGETQYLFLSALSTSEDVVEGFRAGGHDYLRKPFALNELMARVEALLARVDDADSVTEYAIGSYRFVPAEQTLVRNDAITHLSTRESAILAALSAEMGSVVSSHRMLMDIWGDDSYYNLRSMNVFISKLRGYLADDKGVEIISIRGVGYKLVVR